MRLISTFVMSSTSFRAGSRANEPTKPNVSKSTLTANDHRCLSDVAFNQSAALINRPNCDLPEAEVLKQATELNKKGLHHANEARRLEKK